MPIVWRRGNLPEVSLLPEMAKALCESGAFAGKPRKGSGSIRYIVETGEYVAPGASKHTPWCWPIACHKDGRAVLQPYSVTGEYSLA